MDSKSDAKSQLKMIMNPPSIPTKFQTIHYDDNEHRGFNSTAKRFEAKGNDLPGPGYYARAAEKLDQAFADVSVSTKGYGGFASKNKRFHNLKATGTEICKYNPHTPEYSYKQALSPAFRQPVYGKPSNNLMIRTKTGLKPTPGPGEYSVGKNMPSKVITSAFKSKAAKSYLSEMKVTVPEPEIITTRKVKEVEKPILPTSSFKASSREHHNQLPKNPAPGQYNIAKPLWEKTKQYLYLIRKQVRFRFGHIAHPPSISQEPSSNQVAVPGSGCTPIAFPSPGDYDIAKGGDMIHKTQPIFKGIFASKSTRFEKPLHSNNPGPGSYHPFQPKHQSYHLNLDQQWL